MKRVDKEIGRLIRKARDHMNLSPEDVAEELGIPTDQVLRMEFGELRPTSYQLLCICAVLRVNPSWFFPQGWNGEAKLNEPLTREFEPIDPADGFSGEQSLNDAQPRVIEVTFPGGIRVLVGKNFDQIAFSKVVEVLRSPR